MTTLLPASAVAIAAFCVWLTVRIVNRRERWAKWTLAAVVATPALYVLSFGPMRMIGLYSETEPATGSPGDLILDLALGMDKFDESRSASYRAFYRPLISATHQPWGSPIRWYWQMFPHAQSPARNSTRQRSS